MARFKLIFKTKVDEKEVLTPLMKGVRDGKMGPLSVEPESLKVINDVKGTEII